MTAAFDTVVVGGGTAGCVLASRLSEDASRSVLLVEAGPAYPADAYPADLTAGSNMAVEPDRTWGYESVPGPTGHALAVYAGRVLGGGSAINGGISRRARAGDFARWAGHGLPEWTWPPVLAAYKALERMSGGDDAWHGRTGPWPIRQPAEAELTPPVRAFLEAAAALGFARIDDFNGARQDGVGPEIKNLVDDVRMNTAMAYLPPSVRARPNLTIRAGAMVDRVVVGQERATAVRFADGDVVGAGHVVLAAGVYGSPAILLRSGIGPARHLRARGIDVVCDLPVGERLHDQPLSALVYRLQPAAGATPPSGSGIVWTASAEAVDGELDLQLSATVQPDVDARGEPIRNLRIWAAVTTPRASGTVRLKSAEPRVTPRIDYRLLSDARDRRRLVEAVSLARRVARSRPVADLIAADASPGVGSLPAADIVSAIVAGAGTFYHGTSTVPMGGADDPAAVVDATGRVRGLDGLRVVDASIFPEPVSAPTNLTTIMVAERIASFIRTGSLDGGRASAAI